MLSITLYKPYIIFIFLLQSQFLETRGTPSVRAPIANLVDIEPDISCDGFIEALIAHLEKLNGNEV